MKAPSPKSSSRPFWMPISEPRSPGRSPAATQPPSALARRFGGRSDVFSAMDRAKAEARRHHGHRLIDLSLGCTDQPPPPQVTAAMARTLGQHSSAAYCLHAATRPLRVSVAAWVRRRFAVAPDPDTQVLLLVGSQEGTAHFPWRCWSPVTTPCSWIPATPPISVVCNWPPPAFNGCPCARRTAGAPPLPPSAMGSGNPCG